MLHLHHLSNWGKWHRWIPDELPSTSRSVLLSLATPCLLHLQDREARRQSLRDNSLAEFDGGEEERIGRAKPRKDGRMEILILRAPQRLFSFQSRKFVNSDNEFAGCRHCSRRQVLRRAQKRNEGQCESFVVNLEGGVGLSYHGSGFWSVDLRIHVLTEKS
ncbi:unnamed protein product [Linum trigynum]|uniref:Uncharacterized protein n=1 Tax=Linum trigynum TaxID=586398 RepID=A0AAV2GFB0_9ROSI